MKNRMMNQGFTLVELLIVMAIIAILAVGVFVGINPVEQLNKASDTTSAEISRNISSGVERYYAGRSVYPWEVTTVGMYKHTYVSSSATSGISSNTDELIASGELKASSYDRINTNNNIYVGLTSAGDVRVCYIPKSKAARTAVATGATSFYQNFQFQNMTRNGTASPAQLYTLANPDIGSNCQAATAAHWVDGAASDTEICVLCI